MIVLLDANKYLDFYRASKENLKALDLLLELIQQKKIRLILPPQVEEEFNRNKDHVFLEFVEQYLKLNISTPPILEDDKSIRAINSRVLKLREKYESKFYNKKSRVNVLINKLFRLAERPEETKLILETAHFRTQKGNPPRKDNSSFGDAIIWESLKLNYSEDDLVIISRDGDFSGKREKEKIHPLLKKEWRDRNNKNVILHKNLSEYLKSFPSNEVTQKMVEDEKQLIDNHSCSVMDVWSGERFNSEIILTNLQKKCICCKSTSGEGLTFGVDLTGRCLNCMLGTCWNCDKCGIHQQFRAGYSSLALTRGGNLCESCKLTDILCEPSSSLNIGITQSSKIGLPNVKL